MFHREWTDPDGTIHLWTLGTGKTLCGAHVGRHTDTPNQAACRTCVTHLAVYRQDDPVFPDTDADIHDPPESSH